ncbi:MAG: S8 family serine peptidase [Candidatus Zixiibacteriota bacterium]|nr:MAG: S8 family serine peptidase [candidate division Zixibacteria bacterium]
MRSGFSALKSLGLVFSVAVVFLIAGCSDSTSPVNSEIENLASAVSNDGTSLSAKSSKGNMGVNVLLNTAVTDAILADLGKYGKVRDILYKVSAVTMLAKADQIPEIQALPFVTAANPDAERYGRPVDLVPYADFVDGLNTWDQDAINVSAGPGFGTRSVAFTGNGVFVAVLDTGLKDLWRMYFPEERIAEEYAKSFGGGGMEMGNVSEQPNKWEHDNDSHGTHVTSTIIGYSFRGTPVGGTAPGATIIPVKVLGQSGWGWSSVIARGIEYIGDLKAGPLADYPVVINMSLGGPVLDAVEQAAIDYAVAQGVIICASAGNHGMGGMGYPGAYPPVISAAASGWIYEWQPFPNGGWWYNLDVADPINPSDFYIADFSSRELAGQDLDIAAPGSWVVGPYQLQSGKTSYYYLGGTSMASPHVAGVVALMLEKNPLLTAAEAEAILEGSAVPLPAGMRTVIGPSGVYEDYTWGSDATGAGLLDAAAAVSATP